MARGRLSSCVIPPLTSANVYTNSSGGEASLTLNATVLGEQNSNISVSVSPCTLSVSSICVAQTACAPSGCLTSFSYCDTASCPAYSGYYSVPVGVSTSYFPNYTNTAGSSTCWCTRSNTTACVDQIIECRPCFIACDCYYCTTYCSVVRNNSAVTCTFVGVTTSLNYESYPTIRNAYENPEFLMNSCPTSNGCIIPVISTDCKGCLYYFSSGVLTTPESRAKHFANPVHSGACTPTAIAGNKYITAATDYWSTEKTTLGIVGYNQYTYKYNGIVSCICCCICRFGYGGVTTIFPKFGITWLSGSTVCDATVCSSLCIECYVQNVLGCFCFGNTNGFCTSGCRPAFSYGSQFTSIGCCCGYNNCCRNVCCITQACGSMLPGFSDAVTIERITDNTYATQCQALDFSAGSPWCITCYPICFCCCTICRQEAQINCYKLQDLVGYACKSFANETGPTILAGCNVFAYQYQQMGCTYVSFIAACGSRLRELVTCACYCEETTVTPVFASCCVACYCTPCWILRCCCGPTIGSFNKILTYSTAKSNSCDLPYCSLNTVNTKLTNPAYPIRWMTYNPLTNCNYFMLYNNDPCRDGIYSICHPKMCCASTKRYAPACTFCCLCVGCNSFVGYWCQINKTQRTQYENCVGLCDSIIQGFTAFSGITTSMNTCNSAIIARVGSIPTEITQCKSECFKPSPIFRTGYCEWRFSVYDNGSWVNYKSNDLSSWDKEDSSKVTSTSPYGDVFVSYGDSIVRSRSQFDSLVPRCSYVDYNESANNYQLTGLMVSNGDSIYVKNDSTDDLSVNVWGYEG